MADRRPANDRNPWLAGSPALGLVLPVIVALVIAGQHLRGIQRRHAARRRRLADGDLPDPPLHFVDSPNEV